MTDFKQTIDIVRERIKKHRSLYEQIEMAVRDQIVNPLLRSLEWNPENPEEVQPNVSTEEGIPDYSLLKDDKKLLFIEAKKLSIDIEQKEIIRQLANYCFGEGMRFGLLTNGAAWLLFRAFQEGTTLKERILWKTDIEKDNITASSMRLNTISRENIGDIEKFIEKLRILDEIWKSLLEEPEDLAKGFIPVFASLIKEGYPDYTFEQSDVEDFIKERVKELVFPTEADEQPIKETPDKKPPKPPKEVIHVEIMKISNEQFEIRNSYDILINTAEWLIKKGKLRKEDCPISAGYKRNLVNIQSKHRNGEDFTAPKKLSNGLY